MAYEINQRKVAGVVIEANQALMGKGFNHGETVIGLSELIGRVIVDAANNQIQADELMKAAVAHFSRTVVIGMDRKGSPIITGV